MRHGRQRGLYWFRVTLVASPWYLGTVERVSSPDVTRSHLAQITDAHIAWQGEGFGQSVNGLPAVVAAHRLIAGHVDQLPIVVSDGSTVPRWLESPRRFGGPFDQGDLIQYVIGSMFFYGFSALSVTRVGDTSWKVEPLDPAHVQCQVGSGARVRKSWRVDGQPMPELPAVWSQVVDGREYLLHIPYLVSTARPWGTTPLIDALASLQGFAKTEDAGVNIFDSGTIHGGRLETDAEISAAVATAYQERWMQNRRERKMPVLGSGLRYVSELSNSSDLQLLEARQFNQTTIWTMFGIPLDIMGSSQMGGTSSLSYLNATQSGGRYRANALAPFTTQVADGLSQLMAPGRDASESIRIEFDYTAVVDEQNETATQPEEAADDASNV
jgi:hypothetical protein